MDVGAWLDQLGLGQYAAVFAANVVDEEILRQLTDGDLKELGVAALGHRKKLLAAIAALAVSTPQAEHRQPAREAARPGVADETERQLAPGHEALASQRRQVTVLFADLVSSTELARRLDPEDFTKIIRAFQDICIATIRRYEGIIPRFLGDGVLAYFGFPRAHEDDAERAVRAALDLVAAVDRAPSVAGANVRVRVGIATGPVVVGEPDRSGVVDVVGETPSLAARLQSEARAGSVVIAPGTRQLFGNLFEYRELGTRELKGFAEAVPIVEIAGERVIETRFRAIRASRLTPFVGRDQEVALLEDRWRLACEGEGQVVLLLGEAGIGKSRIAETLHERLRTVTHVRVQYQCSPLHVNSALHPAMVQLQVAGQLAPADSNATKLDKLERLLAEGADDVSAVLPLVAALLNIPSDGRYAPLNLTPQQHKEKTLRALEGQLLRLAAQRPVLFVLEDAHWIDPTTRELIKRSLGPVAQNQILMLITARPEFGTPWTERAHVTALTLNRLSQRHCAEMVARIVAGSLLPEGLERDIVRRADGVPLFVEELTKSVVEAVLTTPQTDRWARSAPIAVVPTTLQDSLMARLDRLPGLKEVAQVAAVIGREFSRDLVISASGLAGSVVSDALRQLEEAGLVFRKGDPSNPGYTFKHALVQDAARGSLLRKRRQELRARVATWLEREQPDVVAQQPELIAQHYSEAELIAEAASYWLKAGKLANSRSASSEAIAHLERGIESLHELPPGPASMEIEFDMQIALASASLAGRGYAADEAEAAYLRARDILKNISTLARQLAVFHGLAIMQWNRTRYAEAMDTARELLRSIEARGDNAALCVAHRMIGVVASAMGQFALSRDSERRAWDYYDPDDHRGSAYGRAERVRSSSSHRSSGRPFLVSRPRHWRRSGRSRKLSR